MNVRYIRARLTLLYSPHQQCADGMKKPRSMAGQEVLRMDEKEQAAPGLVAADLTGGAIAPFSEAQMQWLEVRLQTLRQQFVQDAVKEVYRRAREVSF